MSKESMSVFPLWQPQSRSNPRLFVATVSVRVCFCACFRSGLLLRRFPLGSSTVSVSARIFYRVCFRSDLLLRLFPLGSFTASVSARVFYCVIHSDYQRRELSTHILAPCLPTWLSTVIHLDLSLPEPRSCLRLLFHCVYPRLCFTISARVFHYDYPRREVIYAYSSTVSVYVYVSTVFT